MSVALAEQREARAAARSLWWLSGIVGLAVGALRVESLADPNVLWETRDGLTITSSWHLPHADAWSWTVHGKNWVPNSWGWDVILGAAYRLANGTGLVVLNLMLVTALFLGMAAIAAGNGATSRATAAIVGVLGGLIFMPWVIVRPQLASYLFVVAIAPVAARVLSADRRTCAIWIGVLAVGQLIWINLHFFGLVGPALFAIAGVGTLLARARGRVPAATSLREGAIRVALGTVVGAVVCGITPYGAVAASKSVAVRNDAVGLIVEWRPAGFATFSQITAVLALAAAVLAGAHAGRVAHWDVLGLLGVLSVGAATACRFAPVLAVVALPELAAWVSSREWQKSPRRLGIACVSLVALLGVGVGVSQLDQFGKLRKSSNSAELISRLPASCNVLNDYQLGGALIMFRPDVRVSVDSRTDLYGRAGIRRNTQLLDARTGARGLPTRVGCVLAPSRSPLVKSLRTKLSSGWTERGHDGTRTLFVRAG